jgi:hypothetical protein
MARLVVADFRCLLQIRLKDRTVRLQNWTPQPLTYKGRLWNYAPFTIPPLARKFGEDAQTITFNLPNIGSSQHGYIPLRDWVQDGTLSRARIIFWIFTSGLNNPMEHQFVVAERIFDETNPSGKGMIQLRLRPPDDRDAIVLTPTITNAIIGETTSFAAF